MKISEKDRQWIQHRVRHSPVEYMGLLVRTNKRGLWEKEMMVSRSQMERVLRAVKKRGTPYQKERILVHTHPLHESPCRSDFPTLQDIITTLEYEFPLHLIFTGGGVFVLEKTDRPIQPLALLEEILKLEDHFCRVRKSPTFIVERYNKIFQSRGILFSFLPPVNG